MKRKFVIILLAILTALCLLIALVACNNGGKDGENGRDGIDGENGKSAFEIWKEVYGEENSTEEDFLNWLKGENGKDGEDGKDGKDGTIHEHSYGEWSVVLEPTCTSIGYDTRECNDCGDVDYRFNAATGHVVSSYLRSDDDSHAYVCANCNLVVEELHRFDGNVCEGCEFILKSKGPSLSSLYSWIDELDVADIVKVYYETNGIGINPNIPPTTATSTKSVDIQNTYALLFGELEAVELDGGIDGGYYVKYTFYTADNSYTIAISNNLVQIDGQYYRIKSFKYVFQYPDSGDRDVMDREEMKDPDAN